MIPLGIVLALVSSLQEDSSARKHAWTKVFSPAGDDFTAISFVDSSTGHILSHHGWLLRTTDGGLTWKVRRQGVRAQGSRGFEHVWFKDERKGWIAECHECGTGGPAAIRILVTEDGGERWADNDGNHGDKLFDPRSFATRTGETWVRNHFGSVYITPRQKDGSIANCHPSLKDFGKMFDTHYNDVSFADQDRGVLVGKDAAGPLVLLTDDGGRSWSRRTVPGLAAKAVSRVWMSHPKVIRLAAESSVWASRDVGLTWTHEWKGAAGEEIAELCFPSPDFGFAIGKNGLILRYAAR